MSKRCHLAPSATPTKAVALKVLQSVGQIASSAPAQRERRQERSPGCCGRGGSARPWLLAAGWRSQRPIHMADHGQRGAPGCASSRCGSAATKGCSANSGVSLVAAKSRTNWSRSGVPAPQHAKRKATMPCTLADSGTSVLSGNAQRVPRHSPANPGRSPHPAPRAVEDDPPVNHPMRCGEEQRRGTLGIEDAEQRPSGRLASLVDALPVADFSMQWQFRVPSAASVP